MHRVLSCVVLALSVNALYAAEKLTLDQALELADLNHPQLQAGSAAVDVAKAGIKTARAYPNPELNFLTGRGTGPTPLAPAQLYEFIQPLELGALRGRRMELALRGRDSSEYSLEEIRLAVRSRVRRTFYGVLRSRTEIAVAADNLKLVQDLRARVKVRVDVGESGRLELVRAEAEEAVARTAANRAQLELITALNQLRAAVGGGLGTDMELEGNLDPPVMLPSIGEVRQQALDKHPSLALARSEVRRADARVEYEVAQRRPQPNFRTEYDQTNPSVRFGVGIPLPFWNQRVGQIAEARAGRRQLESLSRARENELLSALDAAYGRYQVAAQQVAVYEQGLLQEAQGALTAAEAAFLLGERGIIEVLDAQRVLRTIRVDYLNAQYDRQAALIDVDELRAADLRSNKP
ncbi:MAG: TolC family protein [Bryobacteraceae bacterium]